VSIRSAREHSSDPLSPVINRYNEELIQLRQQATTITDPDSKRIHIDSRSRLKWYDCFNQQQVDLVSKLFKYPLEPDYNDLTIWNRFDHTGSISKDRSLFDNHMYLVGNPRAVEGLDYGLFGGTVALQFDGENDYGYIPEGSNGAGRITDLASGFSVCAVIYPQQLLGKNGEARLFQKIDSANYGYTARVLGDGKLLFASKVNGVETVKETTDTPFGDPTGSDFFDFLSPDFDIVDYNSGPENYILASPPGWFLCWFRSSMGNPPVVKIDISGASKTLQTSSQGSGLPTTDTHDTFVAAGTSGSIGNFPGIYQDYRFMKRQVTDQEILNHNINKLSISNIAYGEIFAVGGIVFGPSASIFMDGSNDYIDLLAQTGLWSKNLTKFSFSIWFYPTATYDIDYRNIVNIGDFTNSFGLGFTRVPNNNIYWSLTKDGYSSEGTVNYTGLTLINRWYNAVCTYDKNLGSQNVKFYIDGVLVGTADYNFTIAIPAAAKLLLGRFELDPPSSYQFSGYQKDFRFWDNKELTQSEVTKVKNNDSDAPTPSYWLPMSLGYGNPVDLITNTKVGTLTNGARWEYSK